MGLTGFGSLFLFLGVVLLFDRALLALGNLLFVAGIAALLGHKKTVKFFLNPDRVRGSILFFGGILVLILGYPFIGMFIEAFGIINLFGNFFPMALAVMRRVPVLETVLNLPYVSGLLDKCAGNSYLLPTSSRD